MKQLSVKDRTHTLQHNTLLRGTNQKKTTTKRQHGDKSKKKKSDSTE